MQPEATRDRPLHSTALDRVAWINFHVSRAGCSFTFPRRLPGLWAGIQGPRTRSVAAPGYKIRQNTQKVSDVNHGATSSCVHWAEREREREKKNWHGRTQWTRHAMHACFVGLLAAQQVVHLTCDTCAVNQSINQYTVWLGLRLRRLVLFASRRRFTNSFTYLII